MYSSLILIIVNKERSIVNTFGSSTVLGNNLNHEGLSNTAEYRSATIGHLVFANTPIKSTVDEGHSLSSILSTDTVPGGPTQ